MSAVSLVDGLALAATLKADREAVVVSRGLSSDVGEALAARLRSLRSLAGREREHALGSMIAALRPSVPPDAVLPARAAALLATEVPRRVGAAWMARAPLPRRGYRASTALRASLRRLAVLRSDVDGALSARDRDEGREILRDVTGGEDAIDRASLLATLAPRERAAITAGDGARPIEPVVDGARRARRIAFVRAAVASGAAHELCEALGGMERGARGEGADRWARAGRECAAMWERACRE